MRGRESYPLMRIERVQSATLLGIAPSLYASGGTTRDNAQQIVPSDVLREGTIGRHYQTRDCTLPIRVIGYNSPCVIVDCTP